MTETQTINLARATAQAAGQAAAHALGQSAAVVVTDAAANAGKKGWLTSEFKATVLGILVAGGVAALHALAVIPSPVMPVAVALSAGLAVASYSISRGNVKKAALDGAAAMAVSLLPAQTGAIETGRTIAAAVIGVDPKAPP
jgi:flagellar biosynthesis component FlhA